MTPATDRLDSILSHLPAEQRAEVWRGIVLNIADQLAEYRKAEASSASSGLALIVNRTEPEV